MTRRTRQQPAETWYAVISHTVGIPHVAYPSLSTAIQVMSGLHAEAPNAKFQVVPIQVIPPNPADIADLPSGSVIDLTRFPLGEPGSAEGIRAAVERRMQEEDPWPPSSPGRWSTQPIPTGCPRSSPC